VVQSTVSADKAFIKAINAKGGLGGHPLTLDFCNDKNDPNTTITCAQQMISNHDVMMAGGNDLNGASLATILGKAGIAEVGINAISGGELNAPNVFIMDSTIPGYVVTIGYIAAHHQKMSLAGADNSTAHQLYNIVAGAATSVHNPYVSQTLVPPTAADMQPFVQSSIRGNPPAIMDFFGQAQEAQFVSGLAKVGNTATVYTADGFPSAASAKMLGGPAEMDRIVSFGSLLPLQDTANPLIKQFTTELAAQAATGDADAQLSQQSFGSLSGWLSLWILQQFVKNGTLNADNITAATVMHAFKTAKNINMEGVMPPWTPNAAGPKGEVRVSNPYYYMWKYTNGGSKIQLLYKKPVNDAQALAGKFGS
jgi:ABC-type branched-subunit amino acid transport system substrate-binding protein